MKVKHLANSVLTSIVILCMWSVSFGQLSIDVGYMGNSFLKNEFRTPINSFNDNLPADAGKMSRFNYLNGIHVGVSTDAHPVIFGVEYNGVIASAAAKNLENTAGTKYKYVLNYSVNGGGLAIGALMGKFSIGTTGLYNFYNIKQFNTIDNERISLAKGQGISLKPWVGFRVGDSDERLNGAFRIFVNYPLYNIDMNSLYQELNPGSQGGPQWKATTFGFTFILINRR